MIQNVLTDVITVLMGATFLACLITAKQLHDLHTQVPFTKYIVRLLLAVGANQVFTGLAFLWHSDELPHSDFWFAVFRIIGLAVQIVGILILNLYLFGVIGKDG